MTLDELTTVADLTRFLEGTQAVAFSVGQDKDARYRWIQGELIRFRYHSLSKKDKGKGTLKSPIADYPKAASRHGENLSVQKRSFFRWFPAFAGMTKELEPGFSLSTFCQWKRYLRCRASGW